MSMAYKLFNKKSSATSKGKGINSQNQQLAEKIYKLIIGKFEKRKVYSSFKDNIFGNALADIELISKYTKGFQFSSCTVDIFIKYTWLVPLKYKR